ncbi:MAG: hypothetical protein C0448_12080, partial [Sphingobacteriaceae bacterium]|nr:hypothetical protein [Sphingobacteriaceae bacterium]
NSTPTISVNSGVICAGQSFTMVPIGALTYTYSGGSDVVTPTADVTYSVSGTDANGCVSLIDAISSVTVNSTPTISVNSGAICAGESFTMVPTGAVSYTYSNGSDVVTPTSDATYSVSGTDANGCVSSIDAVSSVTVNALPTITVISASICAGSTGTLTASGANTYTWNTGANTSVIIDNPLTTTVYDVSGTSSEGCLGSLVTATISVGSAPSIVVNSASVCAGSSATLTANGVTTYTWSTGDNTSSIVVTPTVNTVYSVDGDLIGCSVVASNTATVIVNDLPVITVNSGVICEGESFSIIANGADTYTYSGGSSVVMPVTTSSYTVSGTSLEGCLSSVDAISTVSVNTLPVVSLSSSSSTVCVNGTSVILTGLPTGGVYSGTNVIGNSFVPIATGTYTPVYSYTDAATGCSNSSLVSITVDVCSGVKEATITTGTVKLFPNPNNGLFSIETISSENKTITVTDVAGRVVLSDVSSEMMFNVDMRDLANGFYYVSIKTTHSMEIIKIVKE